MKRRNEGFSALGVLIFFLTIAVTVTVSVLSYVYVDSQTDGDTGRVALVMLFVILFLSAVCTIVDIVRRKHTVDDPVAKILSATEQIAQGDFSVRLVPRHRYGRFDEFDVIMDNINTLAEDLGKSEVLKTDFISNVSHELKTPIAIIKSYAVLLEKETDEDLRKRYAKILSDASERLSGLVTDILKLSKLENEKILPEKEKINLEECLAECVLQFEDKIEKKNIDLACELEELYVISMKSYLEIVFNNLLSNAVKFTDEGGRVAVKLTKEGENAVVQVSDTGCGISPETGARIFDKFYQGDTSHSQEGNGLGLALVKKVIDILGGEISVQSEPNKGSTFTVTLKETVI